MCFTWVGSRLNCKHQIRLGRPAKDKRSLAYYKHLLITAVKRFLTMGPGKLQAGNLMKYKGPML
jgi:hypothetical protein